MNTSPKNASPRRAASPKSARKSPKARVAKSPSRAAASPQRRRPPAGKGNDLETPKPKSSPGTDKKSAKKGLQGDWAAIMLLLLLYTLQGIPMGLGASLPLLMVEKKVSSMEQAVFSMVAYPFAFKLLWAPLVDSVYSSSFGRRKTWIVPAQLAIGALLLTSSFRVNAMLGSDGGSVNVNKLTALFFSFYFLCATQDIAVDGLALTILSERNREYGAPRTAIGQTLGGAPPPPPPRPPPPLWAGAAEASRVRPGLLWAGQGGQRESAPPTRRRARAGTSSPTWASSA